MQRLAAASIAALAGLAIAACGADAGADTPEACLRGPDAFIRALAPAPGTVRLDGGAPISDCIVPEQEAGDISTVGSSLITAATRLNVAGRANPAGNDPVELGYLVGAVESGAEHTSGIHADLLRRLDSAARFSPGSLPPDFSSGYAEGLAAGRTSG
jgi:hypothetical protein